jgi:hypothetical protein
MSTSDKNSALADEIERLIAKPPVNLVCLSDDQWRAVMDALRATPSAERATNAAPQDSGRVGASQSHDPAVAAPASSERAQQGDTPRRWRVKGHGDDLITYWKSKPPHSNEYAAAEIIEELERDLSDANQRIREWRDLCEKHDASRSANRSPVPIPAQCDLLHCTREAVKDGRCSVHQPEGRDANGS